MFVEVIPLARLPKNLFSFDYAVPENFLGQIKIGQIVKIPFHGKKIHGIIIAIKKQPAEIKTAIKPLLKIIDAEENLDKNHLELLRWLTDFYLSSPTLILKTFLPSPPQRTSNFKISLKSQPISFGVAKIDLEEIKNIVKRILFSKKHNFLFHYKNNKNKIAVFLKCVEKILSENKTVLILLPQVSDVLETSSYFLNFFPEKISLLHGELSKTEYWQEWQKIKKGQAKIVLGTRSALFAPLKNLGLIIIDNEEASDFKQSDQNPRYDARDAVLKLGEITGAKVILASQAPRPETYFMSQNNSDFEYFLPQSPAPSSPALIDMNNEIKNKNLSAISEKMKEKIDETLSKKQKVILLLNRRGSGTVILCRDCDHVFKCKTCETPLTCHEAECALPSKFICHNCGAEESTKLSCPKCRGTNIKYFGVGTQTVEKEIKKIFPKTKILRIDKDAPPEKIHHQLADADIFIGTQFFIKNFLTKIKPIGLVGVVSADTLIYRPDFHSGEKIFSWLTDIINFAHGVKSPILIQTFFPNNFIIAAAAEEKPENFYFEELDNRQMLNYPPFGKLIKLVYSDVDDKKCTDEATKLSKLLENNFNEKTDIIFDPKPKREKRKFFSKIIIKFRENSTSVIKEFLKKNVPDSWTIDIDPENIL
ncbi:MAG: primosomal protein N' [Patescibacteria group bacterium]